MQRASFLVLSIGRRLLERRRICSCATGPSIEFGADSFGKCFVRHYNSWHSNFLVANIKRKRAKTHFRFVHLTGLDDKNDENHSETIFEGLPSTLPESLSVKQLRFENQFRMLGNEQAMIELNSILQFWLNCCLPGLGTPITPLPTFKPPNVQEMLQWVESMRPQLHPNLSTYQTLLDGYLKLPGDMNVAVSLLQSMLQFIVKKHSCEDDSSQSSLNADALEITSVLYSFHKVMSLFCKGDHAAWAERLLRDLERVTYDNKIPLIAHESYSIVIAGWAKNGKPREAEHVLYSMMNRMDKTLNPTDSKIMPKKTSFESCLNSWVAYPTRSAGQRAELLVLKMQELCENGYDTKPTYKTFSKIVKAWVNSKHEHALTRVDTILQTLERMDWSDEDNPYNGKTVAETYLEVMRLCSFKDRNKESVKKCVELFSRLDGVMGLKNVDYDILQRMYAALIFTWAQSDLPETAVRVQEIFEDVDAQHKKRFAEASDEVHPHLHVSVYQALLHAFARSGSGYQAENILKRMMQEYLDLKDKSDESVNVNKVDTKSFNSVLLAWSKSSDPDAQVRAEKLFRQMCQLQTSKHMKVRLDVVSYNAVLATLSDSSDEQTARRGDGYFRQMLASNDPSCRPTTVTYTKAISLWSQIGTQEALRRAQELLEEMNSSSDKKIKPNALAYKAFLSVVKKSSSFLPSDEYMKLIQETNLMIKNNGGAAKKSENK
jgi:pentatricopeptide repeat protein